MLREVAWPYSIAREGRGARRPSLECATRLASYPVLRPASKDFARRPSFWADTTRLLGECRALEREWWRERNVSSS